MNLRFYFIVIVFFSSIKGFGQNLIKNPTFNDYFNYYDKNHVKVYHPAGWNYVDSLFNHPIYFSTDRYLDKTFPWNVHPDSAKIKKGEIANYISILIFPDVQRAYTQLNQSLQKGEKYHISMDIKAFEQSNYCSDLLVGFKDTVDAKMDSCLYQLQLPLPDSVCNEFLYDHWLTVNTDFVANGKERILVISSGSLEDYKEIVRNNHDKFLLRNYQGHAKLKYYLDNIILVKDQKIEEEKMIERFETLQSGEKTILKNIYFDFDKSELRPASFIELDQVLNYLIKYPTISIQISGHTDNFGKDTYNEMLSLHRAESVVNYLSTKGISKERMEAIGFGEKQPIDTNESSAGRQNNRRIEMKITHL